MCMLGAFDVGKTSIIDRYVRNSFSEKYLTPTVVKVDTKEIEYNSQDIRLIIWDLNGSDEIDNIKVSYLRGMSGYFLTLDSTRRNTLDIAMDIKKTVEDSIGKMPFIVILNKNDLESEQEITSIDIKNLEEQGCEVIKTSAKTGFGINDAFSLLTAKMFET